MTTAVPLIYSFPEFTGVAEAVADHITAAQNHALYGDANKKKITQSTASASSVSLSENLNSSISSQPSKNASQSHSNVNLANNNNNNSNNNNSNSSSNNSNSNSQSEVNNSNSNAAQRKKKKEENKRFRIGLSGGSLISVLKEGLLKRNDIEWSKWDIYFADERLVPFDSEFSNYGLVQRELLDKIPSEKGKPNVYHIDPTLIDDPQECADQYEKTLIKTFAYKDSVKLPMFDLILLGCAPDGHVASLFPGQETLRENYAWCVPVEDAPSGFSKRITLTVPVICHSHRVSFVVEGATKAPVIRTIMERPDKGLPASIINEKAAGRIAWFVDDDALTDVLVTKKRYKFLVNNKEEA